MSTKSQLEPTTKSAVFSFGRMNPPTAGHKTMIENALTLTQDKPSFDYFLFPSRSIDKQPKTKPLAPHRYRNPIPLPTKLAFLQEVLPQVNIIDDPEIKAPVDVIDWMIAREYQAVYFAVGSDRVEEFQNRWLIYTHGRLQFANVIEVGKRDSNSEGIAGMSSTAARSAAIDDDLVAFKKATGWDDDLAKRLFDATRKGMGLDSGRNGQSVQDKTGIGISR